MEHDEGVIWNNAITRSKAHPVQNNKKVRKDLSSYRSFQRFLKKKNARGTAWILGGDFVSQRVMCSTYE